MALHPSASPEPSTLANSNGHGAENGATENGTTETDASTLAERSIAMLNLPDTVNLARLEKLFEPHGEVRKLQLRPDLGGAIIEFAHAQTVGRARLALEGTEIDGARIEFGAPAALLKHGAPHVKKDAEGGSKAANAREGKKGGRSDKKADGPRGALAMVPRAMAPRKVGLGPQSWRNARRAEAGEPASGKAKSNADFRAMLMGKEPAKDETSPKDASPKDETPKAAKEDTEMS